MYTHVKLIKHGLNYMKYLRGETSYKGTPDRITEIDIPTVNRINSSENRYLQMRLDSIRGNPSLADSSIQITLSPLKEDTIRYSGEDWQKLWMTFLIEMDRIDRVKINDKHNKLLVKKVEKTNLANSNQLVGLHMDSKSEVPHIHAAISPVDKNGRPYSLDYLMERARMAALEVESEMGLTDTSRRRPNNISTAYHTCLDVVLNMTNAWSLDQFRKGIRQHRYRFLERRDEDGNLLSWAMKKGKKIFVDRDLSEDFLVGNLYSFWYNLVKPYNNPAQALSLSEIIEEIKLRGWYERFLAGDIQNPMEAALFELLQQKLIMDHSQMDAESMSLENEPYYDYDWNSVYDPDFYEEEEEKDVEDVEEVKEEVQTIDNTTEIIPNSTSGYKKVESIDVGSEYLYEQNFTLADTSNAMDEDVTSFSGTATTETISSSRRIIFHNIVPYRVSRSVDDIGDSDFQTSSTDVQESLPSDNVSFTRELLQQDRAQKSQNSKKKLVPELKHVKPEQNDAQLHSDEMQEKSSLREEPEGLLQREEPPVEPIQKEEGIKFSFRR